MLWQPAVEEHGAEVVSNYLTTRKGSIIFLTCTSAAHAVVSYAVDQLGHSLGNATDKKAVAEFQAPAQATSLAAGVVRHVDQNEIKLIQRSICFTETSSISTLYFCNVTTSTAHQPVFFKLAGLAEDESFREICLASQTRHALVSSRQLSQNKNINEIRSRTNTHPARPTCHRTTST